MCILSSIHVPCSVFEIFVRPICYQKPLDFRLCHFPLDFCVCCCLLKFIVMLLGNPVECTASVNMPYYGVYFVSRSLFRGASFSIRFSFSHLIKGSPFSICREQLFCVPFFPFLFRCCCCIFFFCCSKTQTTFTDIETLCDAIILGNGTEPKIRYKFGDVLFGMMGNGLALPLSLRLLMVFDHKLINYGLFWISVSGLSLHNRVHLSLCFNFNFRICQT